MAIRAGSGAARPKCPASLAANSSFSSPGSPTAPRSFTTYSPTIVPDWSSQPHSAGEVLPLVINRSNWTAVSLGIMI
jgi:hypothetical protein